MNNKRLLPNLKCFVIPVQTGIHCIKKVIDSCFRRNDASSERGQAMVEAVIIFPVVTMFTVAVFYLLDVYVTKMQLVNGARIGTDYVVHANPYYTNTTSVDRTVWDLVRDALCHWNKGGIAGEGVAKGRILKRISGLTPAQSRNNFNLDVNVWCESWKWGDAVPPSNTNTLNYPVSRTSGSNITYYNPANPLEVEPFFCVVRYRIPVSPLIQTLIGQDHIEVTGRSLTLNDTGVENTKNFSKS